eukprot:CAMPEP_0197884476 /NCGR_PEP_ID=MMETSP1439-20131203/10910_1 /TAXON_ID=66791 /ORGANISM="Gonyaulax spinifera, Strain CCMP409" /LENGTH=290 /DNA_ID=CAMNT_0043504209 /DNA_START=112 /DNA_END=984 /DNA_ORIENTATION=+
MAKSIRAKIKKRLRTVKRQRIDAMVITPRMKESHEALKRVIQGRGITFKAPKNAFKFPEADAACFPQHEVMKPVDFRATHMPMAGYCFRGNRRKYDGEQAQYMENLSKTSHPEMEVLAGGGAICAKTGQRMTKKEAEIRATAAVNPDAVRNWAGPASSGDAVEAALAASAAQAGDAEMADGSAAGTKEGDAQQVEPENKADHTRLPVVKDARRAKRTAEHRPRPNSVKKKGKNPAAPAKEALPVKEAAPAAAAPAAAVPVPAAAASSAGPAVNASPAGKKKKKKTVTKDA